jgi:hypothetical protein
MKDNRIAANKNKIHTGGKRAAQKNPDVRVRRFPLAKAPQNKCPWSVIGK